MHLRTVAVTVALCAVACKKKDPPNITGAFEGPMQQSFLSRAEHRPMTMGSRFTVKLSDEQEGSTAVQLLLHDTIAGGTVACAGRAPRTDRDDGATFAVPSFTCHFSNPDGTPSYQSPQCAIQSQAVGLRYDRATSRLSLDIGGLDVAFTTTPPEDREPCNNWLRATAERGAAMSAAR